MMNLSTRQTIETTKYWLEMLFPSLTMVIFIAFAFLMGSMIVLSMIPLYLGNQSVEKTSFIQTTVRLSNYSLNINRSLGKRDLSRLINISTLAEGEMIMNSSIQYALEQQLQAGDNRDKFYIIILQMTAYTDNPINMSVILDFLIVYTRECISCNKHRQLIIFQQLCSNNQLSNSIRFLIHNNLSYALSDPVIVYTSYIPIENIIVTTGIISTSSGSNTVNNTNSSNQISNQFLANNYILTVTTGKSNYIATLDEAATQISANPNAGPVPLVGALTMYYPLTQIIQRQTQITNSSTNVVNITINHINLQFWYSNSTIQILIDFLIYFSTSCDNQCMNQRSYQLQNQLANLTNTQIYIQPANLTDGQVRINKSGSYVLYNYSLTAQVITNFTGTITYAVAPTLTIIY